MLAPQAMYLQRNTEVPSRNHRHRGNAISTVHSVCVCVCVCVCVSVALFIQHAMRMRRIILSSVACPTAAQFSTLSHQQQLSSSEISPTRCNNCVFILRNGFTLHVSGDNLTHHQE